MNGPHRFGSRWTWVFAAGALLLVGGAIGMLTRSGPEGSASQGGRAVDSGVQTIRVEVLNAGGRKHMARLATNMLRDAGFDVVYFGNARTFGRERSVVIDRRGGGEGGGERPIAGSDAESLSMEARASAIPSEASERASGSAAAVAAALGIMTIEVEPDPGLHLDFTVLLGSDWQSGTIDGEELPPDGDGRRESPWWDIRRFWR